MILKREEVAGEVMAAEPHPSLAEDCEKTKKGENASFLMTHLFLPIRFPSTHFQYNMVI